MNILPDYQNRSIVNLMASICKSMNYTTPYSCYSGLDPQEINKFENIILLIIDGMGYEYVQKEGKNTFFQKYLQDRLTSIFPSTTAAAITAYSTGLSTQQHALTGWFIYFKEIAIAAIGLPFVARAANTPLQLPAKHLLNFPNLYDNIERTSYYIVPRNLKNTAATDVLAGKSNRLGYKNLRGFGRHIIQTVNKNNSAKYIYAYWSNFDKLCHLYGAGGNNTKQHFFELNEFVTYLSNKLANSNSLLIVSSDHGMLDIKPQNTIYMADHPKLAETLVMPLSGEPRIPYCYVKASRRDDFLEYMTKNLAHAFKVKKSCDLIEENYFGLGWENTNLRDRIGDYALLPKADYVFKDGVMGEKIHDFIGYHAGLSSQEMYIPLIIKSLR